MVHLALTVSEPHAGLSRGRSPSLDGGWLNVTVGIAFYSFAYCHDYVSTDVVKS